MHVSIPRRRLGRGALDLPPLECSAIGLGCMGMSEFYGPSDDAESLKTLHHALDIGVDFLDTADMYGSGDNERLLAKLLKTRRGEVVLATKFGFMRDPNDPGARPVNGRPEYVKQAADASLQRLGVEYIDLYYQHRVDPNVPIEETVGAMADLVKAGKVRHLGLSEASAATLRRASKVHPIAALQSEYSLWSRDIEEEILPACHELGIGVVAYSPLGRGFLTGAIQAADDLSADDFRRQNPRFLPGNIEVNRNLVDALGTIARARGCTPAQLALAWLLDRAPDVVPIPGTRKISRLDENAAAARIRLSDAERRQIDGVLDTQTVVGERYAAVGRSLLNG
jgi:aryl-alcohol dehydrogenase-like predicted oxidoreductase